MNSIIPNEPPRISFYGEGNCSSKKLKIWVNGTHNPVITEIYKAAGFELSKDFQHGIHICSCAIGCFKNKSLITENVLLTQVPGHTAFVNKKNLDLNIK